MTFLKASGGTTKFSIHFYSSEQFQFVEIEINSILVVLDDLDYIKEQVSNYFW